MRGRFLSLVLASSLLALVGCGGEESLSHEEQVAASLNAWNDALERGDGDAACALMTASGQVAMTDPYDGIGPNRPPIAQTCEAAVVELAKDISGETGPEVDASDVTISGDRAVAQPDGDFCTYVRRVDGWMIEYLPLPGPDDPDASGEIPPCEPRDSF
jgi:hypothetical protein